MTLLEAMACGCVCMANNIETSMDIIDDAGIVVNVEDTENFSRQIISLLKDKQRQTILSHLARNRAVEKYDYKIAVQKFNYILTKYKCS